jgi:hypothetical protein
MNRLETFVARWLIRRLVRWPWSWRLGAFFALMQEEVNDAFPEDSRYSTATYLAELAGAEYTEGR